MNLVNHYDNLYTTSIHKIKSDDYQIDPLIDSTDDNRFGLTLITRPDDQVKNKIRPFLNKLKVIEPDQYYYPDSDIHVTVLAIISCHAGFELSKVSIPDYIELIKKSLSGQKSFEITFRGITASPSCIMIQGFLKDNTLNEIRNTLRTNFKSSGLQQTIDQRYAIQTAHSTVVRFRKWLSRKDDFLKALDQYRDYDFGTTTINTLELVSNDWYQRKESQKDLYRFNLIDR